MSQQKLVWSFIGYPISLSSPFIPFHPLSSAFIPFHPLSNKTRIVIFTQLHFSAAWAVRNKVEIWANLSTQKFLPDYLLVCIWPLVESLAMRVKGHKVWHKMFSESNIKFKKTKIKSKKLLLKNAKNFCTLEGDFAQRSMNGAQCEAVSWLWSCPKKILITSVVLAGPQSGINLAYPVSYTIAVPCLCTVIHAYHFVSFGAFAVFSTASPFLWSMKSVILQKIPSKQIETHFPWTTSKPRYPRISPLPCAAQVWQTVEAMHCNKKGMLTATMHTRQQCHSARYSPSSSYGYIISMITKVKVYFVEPKGTRFFYSIWMVSGTYQIVLMCTVKDSPHTMSPLWQDIDLLKDHLPCTHLQGVRLPARFVSHCISYNIANTLNMCFRALNMKTPAEKASSMFNTAKKSCLVAMSVLLHATATAHLCLVHLCRLATHIPLALLSPFLFRNVLPVNSIHFLSLCLYEFDPY